MVESMEISIILNKKLVLDNIEKVVIEFVSIAEILRKAKNNVNCSLIFDNRIGHFYKANSAKDIRYARKTEGVSIINLN
jgi:hypothetical protein